MIHVEPGEISIEEVYRYLLGGIAPRPIALTSTISETGINNLSPFSFFNAFGGNPPTIGFSPSRRQRDGSVKDTYNNLVATGECVVQAVTFAMVQQVSLASTEYGSEVDEFVKSGLTPVDSDIVRPKRVKESPFQMECRVKDIIALGEGPGSGNLVICEVVKFHVDENIMVNGQIQPDLIDLVGRNSADFYTRASGEAIFEVANPLRKKGIGYDQLPQSVRTSCVLTANNLAQLANCETMPSGDEAHEFAATFAKMKATPELFEIHARKKDYKKMLQIAINLHRSGFAGAGGLVERSARIALSFNDTDFAWKAVTYLGTFNET